MNGTLLGMETLQDLLREVEVTRGLKGGTAMMRVAKAAGIEISHVTLNHMIKGDYLSKPEPRTLDAIAVIGNMDRARVYAAAEVPMPTGDFIAMLPDGVDQLGPRARSLVLDLIRGLLEIQGESSNVVMLNRDRTKAPTAASVSRYSKDQHAVAYEGDGAPPGSHGDGEEWTP